MMVHVKKISQNWHSRTRMIRVKQQDDELILTALVEDQDDGRMKARMMARMTNRKNQV